MWYYIVLLLALYIYTVAREPSPQEMIVVGIVAFVLVVVALYRAMIKHDKEQFVDQPISNSLDSLLTLFGIKTGAEHNYVVSDDIPENLADIESGLILYYSSFDKASFPGSAVSWKNIAPFFKTPQTDCPEITYNATHLTFETEPGYARDLGFTLNQNKITGPKSHLLGINGNGSFTLGFLAKFDSFSPSTLTFDLYQQFANLPGMSGIKLYIKPNSTMFGTDGYAVNMVLQIGSKEIPTKDPGNFESPSYILHTSQVYLIMVTKEGAHVSLDLYPNVGNISGTTAATRLIDQVDISQEEIMFSNKPVLINGNKNLSAKLYSVAIYNRALNTDQSVALFNHYKIEVNRSNRVIKEFVTKIQELKGQIANSRACPYNEAICTECVGIDDWTNMQEIITNASQGCLNAIHQFCSQNPTNKLCACWNSKNVVSRTTQCQNYVSIFSSEPQCTMEKITPEMLDQIKSRNNLCSCQDIDAIRQALLVTQQKEAANSGSIVVDPVPRPKSPPQLDPDNYYVDQDYINIYEKYAPMLSREPNSFSEKLVNWISVPNART